MKTPKRTISGSFLAWLTVIVLVAITASISLSWGLQTQLSNQSAEKLLHINIADVQQEILEKSDRNLLALTHAIADELPEETQAASERLKELMRRYDVSEIDVINTEGIITACTQEEFVGFDMHDGEQAAEFLCLTEGSETEYVQKFQPISYNSTISRKYAGVRFENGGFVQVGYDAERFQKDVDQMVVGITHNRHVGQGGYIMVADRNWNLVSDLYLNEGRNIDVSGLRIDRETVLEDQIFHETVYGVPSCCLYAVSEGYAIVAVIPENEIVMQRDTSVLLSSTLEIYVFLALFGMIYLLVRKLVVSNINKVNDSLSKITEGDLEEVVDVRSNTEFSALSDDINATVSTLKQYIASAAARIDEELALAKNIQQSALPSVFPPWPGRKDFSLYATMDTAKEVGGDFYDFYLLDDKRLVFLAADVSGKGIPAAMFMMTGKTVIRDYAERGDTPVRVIGSANDKLCEGNDAEMFITAWVGFLDTDSGTVRYINAGHNPPVLIRDGQASFIPQEPDPAMAVMEGIRYREQGLQLGPGDLLFLYTDGAPEASDVQEEMYGEDRMLRVLSADFGTGEEACRRVCRRLKEDIDSFVGDAPQFDDITMLCLYYGGPAEPDRAPAAMNREGDSDGSCAGDESRESHAAETAAVRELRLEEARSELTDDVVAFVDGILEEEACPTERQMQIDLAVEELYVNIASYAYAPGCGPATVRVETAKTPHAVTVTFIDRGMPYNPLEEPDPELDLPSEERPIGGLGIYLVKNSVDGISYERREEQNVLQIRMLL
ncbi:MAG: SpoIIE family protein phosphatase [Oscillospiraceae bacterium]|nr:SpoIIE family protein phosphatase [Oscillospiraceae bacterium]